MNIDANAIIQAKILNGVTGGGGVKPTGTKQIVLTDTQTVTEDVTQYAEVEVQTSGLVKPTGNKAITITNPGTVSDIDVSGEATASVTTEGLVKPTGNKAITITEPGTVSNIDVSAEATASVTTQGLVKPTGTLQITENGTGINVSEYAAVDVNVSGSGDLPAWDERGLSYNSWDTIAKYAEANELINVANFGDEKDGFIFVAVGQNPNLYPNDTAYRSRAYRPNPMGQAHFMARTFGTSREMNNTADNTGGYRDSALRTYLNDTIYNGISQAIRDVMVKRYMYVYTGTVGSAYSSEMIQDYVWLPSAHEWFGDDSTYNRTNYPDVYVPYLDSFPRFAFFFTAEARKRGSSMWTWTRDAVFKSSGTTQFYRIGSASSTNWSLNTANANTNNRFMYGITIGKDVTK